MSQSIDARDTERLDAIADGVIQIRQNHDNSWTARHVDNPVWLAEGYHLAPTLREAVDAALSQT